VSNPWTDLALAAMLNAPWTPLIQASPMQSHPPKPKRLRFETISLPSVPHPISVASAPDAPLRVDARSLVEAAGVSWRTWRLAFEFRACDRAGISQYVDQEGRSALLMTTVAVLEWTAFAMGTYSHKPVKAKLEALRTGWCAYDLACRAQADKPGRKRHVKPEVVRQLYELVSSGCSPKEARQQLRISRAVADHLARGTYPSFDAPTFKAWLETFGSSGLPEANREARPSHQTRANPLKASF
jgi:hypothetical protein